MSYKENERVASLDLLAELACQLFARVLFRKGLSLFITSSSHIIGWCSQFYEGQFFGMLRLHAFISKSALYICAHMSRLMPLKSFVATLSSTSIIDKESSCWAKFLYISRLSAEQRWVERVEKRERVEKSRQIPKQPKVSMIHNRARFIL